MRTAYLIIDGLVVVIPLLFSFHPKIKFYNYIPSFLFACFIVSTAFIFWDILFTQWRVWGFNPQYITGFYFVNLPIEEVLFFYCIPYACIFTYTYLEPYIPQIKMPLDKYISCVLMIMCFILACIYFHQKYTFVTFGVLLLSLFILQFVLKVTWLLSFYAVYLILLIPFTIVNGILTGAITAEPIVWYNNEEIIKLRIITIPFEDIFYGMLLILLIVSLQKWINKIIAR
ncbi:MAG: lycopene cyclase domain-containing protein [Phycisphaerales bacterium]|nr:lycopene cyclase domain-containing protein [Phycisphaerales bacterium]